MAVAALGRHFKPKDIEKLHGTPDDTDRDTRLPYVLFVYCASLQESTKESSFSLLYVRDLHVPMSTILTYQRSPYTIDIDDYKSELMAHLSQAWKVARDSIKVAQKHQKTQYDKNTRDVNLKVGDRVMVLMPIEAKGEKRKLARPFHGPFLGADCYSYQCQGTIGGRP